MELLKSRPKLAHLSEETVGKANKRAKSHVLNSSYLDNSGFLSKIQEEEEIGSLDTDSVNDISLSHKGKGKSAVKKLPFMKRHFRKYTEIPQLSPDKRVAFFQSFLNKLKEFPDIFEEFAKEASLRNVIKPSISKRSEYYYKHIHLQNSQKYRSISRTPVPAMNYSLEFDETKRFKNNTPLGFTSNEQPLLKDLIKLPAFAKVFNQFHQNFDTTSRASSRKSSRPTSKLRRFNRKQNFLDRTKPKLIYLYQEMCGTPKITLKLCRLSSFSFYQYLCRRYPKEISESIVKHFDFKNGTFEEFCGEIDKFIGSPDEKHLSFCFDLFDFNKDKYVCYQDAYYAMKIREEDYYDNDLIKLNKMFDLKKQGKIPTKKPSRRSRRRKSVFSVTSETDDEEEEKRKNSKIPHYNLEKPEALTVEDFSKIE